MNVNFIRVNVYNLQDNYYTFSFQYELDIQRIFQHLFLTDGNPDNITL